MPIVTARTFGAAPGPAGSCAAQLTVTPQTTMVYGCPADARRKAVQVMQGVEATIQWQLVDLDGKAVDLTSCGTFEDGDASTGEVRLRTRETILYPGTAMDARLNIAGTVTSPEDGLVTFALGATGTRFSGIFLAEAAVYSSAGTLVFLNQFYLVVNRSLLGDPAQASGIPSIAEIRLHMRDSDPADNPLLEAVQFDLAEIAAAIEKPVLYWNESQPPICQRYTTTTYPFRLYWLEGIVSQLYLMAAHFYRRNRLPHSAGGVQVDDLNKAQEYEQLGKQKWDEYKQWVLMKKVQLNAESAVQTLSSPYIHSGVW
jgi:hypothetical protein